MSDPYDTDPDEEAFEIIDEWNSDVEGFLRDSMAVWFRYDTWTVRDGLLLLSGLDPKRAKFDREPKRGRIPHDHPSFNEVWLLGVPDESRYIQTEFYEADLSSRCDKFFVYCDFWLSGSDHKNKGKYSRGYYRKWAQGRSIDIPWGDFDGLESVESSSLQQSERASLLKLVYGMAMDKYDYAPSSSKNPATGNKNGSIKVGLEQKGIALDEETIRKYLRIAVEELGDPPN